MHTDTNFLFPLIEVHIEESNAIIDHFLLYKHSKNFPHLWKFVLFFFLFFV